MKKIKQFVFKLINIILAQLKKIYLSHKKLSLFFISIFLFNYLLLFTLKIIPYKELDEFRNKSYSTRIYDTNGYLIQVTSLENGLRREFTPYSKIPKEIINIFLESEDKRFFFHHGIDYLAILNAFIQNSQSGDTVRGASTITMQLSKMINSDNEKTFSRKFKDIFNAFRIEAKLSKKEILELYLNSVPFGLNSEGISSAARTFYGKELENLTTEEICCLSIIPRSPSFYNPIKNPDNNASKALLIYKKINKSESEEILYKKILTTAKSSHKFVYPFLMPHYVNYLKNEWKKENYVPYEIQVAADLNIQSCAEQYLIDALKECQNNRITNGAVLVLDNTNNSIIAWVGNGNFFDEKSNGQLDSVLSKNQPGSSMKPFLYATAMDIKDEKGNPYIYPSKVLADIPKEFGAENIYIPANFNNRYNGPIRTRIALSSSLNVPAVSILDKIGTETYLNKLNELGINSIKENSTSADLGLALGGAEVNLLELVTAFSVFPRDGLYIPYTYKKNTKQKNKNKISTGVQVFSKDTARIICSILSDKSARSLGFGSTQTFETNYPSIFKTGTANQYQDIVALGATKYYTIGVWMGNLSGNTVIGKTGSSLPAWVAKNTLDFIINNYFHFSFDELTFEEPKNYTKIKLCTLSGDLATDLCESTYYDYVPNDMTLDYCKWHRQRNNKVFTFYPPEYQQWFKIYGEKGFLDYHACNLQFLTPNNNSKFYYSENLSLTGKQSISFEIIGGKADIAEVFYDNNFYTKLDRPFSFYLPLEIGEHCVKVICEKEQVELFYTVN